MLPRILEPEVMDTAAEAADYNAMDHRQVNRCFVDDLLAALPRAVPPADGIWRVFDAGTGTALIPLELAAREIPIRITAADAAGHMLRLAQENVTRAGRGQVIYCVHRDCKHLPEADATFEVVMSNSIIHHIPQPVHVLRECWRILRPGGLLFFRDLLRPPDETTLEELVRLYAGEANRHQRQMFRNSLHAALTVAEVADLLDQLGLPTDWVRATSDRHWTICGVKTESGSPG
uniref:Class I SAM-dependent methyltransferase n=1 Tax=Schlesneria paludicola TaxID=360056 RepID=A0A7C4QQ83_9PLAN